MPQSTAYKSLVESQVSIARSLEGINKILEKINDSNIAHQQSVKDDHIQVTNLILGMQTRDWWLILALIGVILAIVGYPSLTKFFIRV